VITEAEAGMMQLLVGRHNLGNVVASGNWKRQGNEFSLKFPLHEEYDLPTL